MGFGFHSIRGRMGQSPMGGGADGLLERSGCKHLRFRNLEDGSSLFNVYLEGTQCSKLCRL